MKKDILPVFIDFEKEVRMHPKEFFMQFSKKEILVLLSTGFVKSYWNVYCFCTRDITEENCWFAQKNKEEIINEFVGWQNKDFDDFFLKSKEIIEKIHEGLSRKDYDFYGKKVDDSYRNFKLKYNVSHPAEYFKKFSKKELLKLFNTKYIKSKWNYCFLFIGKKEEITEENCEWIRDNDSESLAYDFCQDGLSERVIDNAKKIIDRISLEGNDFKDDYSEYKEFQKKFKQKAEDFFMKYNKNQIVEILNTEYVRNNLYFCRCAPKVKKIKLENCWIAFPKVKKIHIINEVILNDLIDEDIIIKIAKMFIKKYS